MPYYLPTTVDDALSAAVASGGDFAYVAGGTDQMVQREQGTARRAHLIDLTRIAGLREISVGKTTRIGAGVTLGALVRNASIAANFPSLVAAARAVATPAIRAAGTVGGNLLCENRCMFFDQSAFWREAVGNCLKCGGDVCIATSSTKNCYSVCVSDLAPALVALEATVSYRDASGTGSVPLEKIYTGDGTGPRALPSEAIVTAIDIPSSSEGSMLFRKLRARDSVDFTNLSIAMRLANGTLHVALTGVASRPVPLRTAPTGDAASIVEQLLRACTIIDNLPFTRLYRKEMLTVFVKEGLSRLKI